MVAFLLAILSVGSGRALFSYNRSAGNFISGLPLEHLLFQCYIEFSNKEIICVHSLF